jgi:signal transduction histidine kinase
VEKLQAERRLAGLVEAGISLAAELDVDALLQRIADLARDVIGARYAAVGILDQEGLLGRFVHSGVDDATRRAIGDLPRGKGVLGVIIEEGRPLRLSEIGDHPRSVGFPEHHPEMHTFLGVPVVGRDGVLGRLYFSEKLDGGQFSKDDERIAMTFAGQAGVALDNSRLYEDIRRRSDELARRVSELASVERVAQLLISGTTIEEALETAAEEARSLTRASRAVIALIEGSSRRLVVRVAAGDVIANDLIGTVLPEGGSKSYFVMDRGKAELIDDMGSDPEVNPATLKRLGHPRKAAFVPILIRGRGVGAIAAYDTESGDPFSEDDVAVLQIIANQVAIAVENERLTESLRDLAVLEERERISKELHDGVIQSIYSVGLSLQGSMSLLERDPERARVRVDEAIATLDNVVRDVRSYIFELRPKLVEERGLAAAIQELGRDYEVNTLARAVVELDPDACGSIRPDDQTHVIQIAREVLSNIARHAQASHVFIACEGDDEEIRLTIEDDGLGFDPETVKRGQGLTNMEARARSLEGSLTIEPREPVGTRHLLRMPRSEKEGSG